MAYWRNLSAMQQRESICAQEQAVLLALQALQELSILRHQRNDLREHKEAAPNLVPNRLLHAGFQEGHERAANPSHGVRGRFHVRLPHDLVYVYAASRGYAECDLESANGHGRSR